jgi:hypothetical protein
MEIPRKNHDIIDIAHELLHDTERSYASFDAERLHANGDIPNRQESGMLSHIHFNSTIKWF